MSGYLINKQIKLTELKDDEMLIVGEIAMTKAEFVAELDEYRGEEVWTTKRYDAKFNATEVLDCIIEQEYQEMYDGWDKSIKKCIHKEDIEEIQKILDRILKRNSSENYSYEEKKEWM